VGSLEVNASGSVIFHAERRRPGGPGQIDVSTIRTTPPTARTLRPATCLTTDTDTLNAAPDFR
jgi:hypothetical protein